MEASIRRVRTTANHLVTEECSASAAVIVPQTDSNNKGWDLNAMWELLEHDNCDYKKTVIEFLKDPTFNVDDHDVSMDQARERTLTQVKRLLESGLVSVAYQKTNPGKFIAFMEKISLFDCSMGVKLGVHMVLFGGAIMHLGTEKHHQKYIPLIDSFQLPGCFGMTELGHGSNVQGIETEARYDVATREFIINTPSDSAQKYWIGGAAKHAQVCAVFAQLIVGGVNYGVHVFVVPIRNPDGSIAENVRIKDNGHKMGLLGVDNGRIWFDNKRIPRDNLLNRFGDVSEDGKYTSPYSNNMKRFGAMVAPLVGGRVSIALGALDVSKIVLFIAIKYSLQRKQFGKNGAEIPIMNYLTQQRRLCTSLACTYMYNFGLNYVMDKYNSPKDSKELHVLASGFKAVVTWHKTETVQLARECCGGQGFSTSNRIAELKADTEIDMTYEGDNHVLLQQVGRSLLVDYLKGKVTVHPSVNSQPPNTVRNLDTLLAALKWRETNVLQELSNRMMNEINSGVKEVKAFNNQLDLVTALGKACVDRVSFEKMVEAIEKSPSDLQQPLERVARLAAMWRIEKDLGWFVTFGGISRQMANVLLIEVNNSCRDVAESISDYVDSFQLPPHLIRSPIAYDYLEYNRYDRPENHVQGW